MEKTLFGLLAGCCICCIYLLFRKSRNKRQYRLYVNPDGKMFYEDENVIALVQGVTYIEQKSSLYYYSNHITKKNNSNDKTKIKRK